MIRPHNFKQNNLPLLIHKRNVVDFARLDQRQPTVKAPFLNMSQIKMLNASTAKEIEKPLNETRVLVFSSPISFNGKKRKTR